MTIPANSEKVYWDSPTTVVNISAGNMTNGQVAGMTGLFTNTNYCPRAVATLTVTGASVAPTAGRGVELYAVRQNLAGGTADATAGSTITGTPATPSAGFTNYVGAEMVGYFPLEDSTSGQVVPIDIDIRSVYESYYFIRNDSGQTLTVAGGNITVAIHPYTSGPS